MEGFDIIEYENLVKQTSSPRDLYLIMERVSKFYENRQINNYEYNEIKDLILPKLQSLAGARKSVNG